MISTLFAGRMPLEEANLDAREGRTMPTEDACQMSVADVGTWGRKLGPYRKPNSIRGVLELAITMMPLALAWFLMFVTLHFGYFWLYALLVLPAAGLLVRLFMIQHDCGHGSFFPNRTGNDWVGRVIGVLTLMPYDHWRRGHAIHHATAGNLDNRGIGDVDTLTVAEYLGRSAWGRFRYRLYRHPAVMFGLGPAYLFLLQSRLPIGFMRKGWTPWVSTMATNLAVVAFAGLMIWTIGFVPFLLIHLPIVLVGAAIGVWLFYIQHQFEDTHWARNQNWNAHEMALRGSSYYDLPIVLNWFTANIGVHHVHHLSSRIPYYRLQEVLRDYPELRKRGRLTLLRSLGCVRLALWDEASQRLISFKELRQPAYSVYRMAA
jgi:omega-6 fatty acid desaturase (delta-12 desaturase)